MQLAKLPKLCIRGQNFQNRAQSGKSPKFCKIVHDGAKFLKLYITRKISNFFHFFVVYGKAKAEAPTRGPFKGPSRAKRSLVFT